MKTDYCTSWWDGWPAWLGGTGDEWANCCKAHDEFYAGYDGWLGYLGAHWDLAVCVGQSASWAMGGLMLAGLTTFGSLVVISRKNKIDERGKEKR